MASLLPLIQDLLPMILPSQIHITRGRDLLPVAAPTLGQGAVVPGAGDVVVSSSEANPGEGGPERPRTNPAGSVAATIDSGVQGTSTEGRPSPGERVLVRRDAIVDKTDKMCASVLFAGPGSSSAVHHNSEHDTIIYAASGRGILATSPPDDDAPPKRDELEPGDFAFIPAWNEHQLVNETDDQVVWVVIQGGPSPIVVNLKEWGGAEARS